MLLWMYLIELKDLHSVHRHMINLLFFVCVFSFVFFPTSQWEVFQCGATE